ncbi:MAG: hypothetical protein M3364_03455 [Actinomycetota bacterium]|nr:hypothetical protein [Actinomycetota bacterium]
MASNWNAYFDRKLEIAREIGMTEAESRLADTLARLLLGYRKTEGRLGRAYLCDVSGLDTRNLERARTGLIAKGLIRYESSGAGGRGRRSLYTLLLDGKGRPSAAVSPDRKVPLPEQETAAVDRPRIGRRKGKNPPTPAASTLTTGVGTSSARPIHARAAEAYLGAGGSLELDQWRATLARQVKTLTEQGVDEKLIVDASVTLGREQQFPGYLQQAVSKLEAEGGLCVWRDLDRLRLSDEQLATCECNACQSWLARLSEIGAT